MASSNLCQSDFVENIFVRYVTYRRAHKLGTLLISVLQTFSAALPDAVEHEDHSAVRALIQNHDLLNETQPDGMTALHWAVYQDDLETASLLVTAGANVKATNHYGVMPLSLACLNGNEQIVTLLTQSRGRPK